ncbi:MAG: helix-turn-helix transcriptional regulator [Gemmatimonadetes bacterium]|nr:helix-turn-helix transcriptional regulator [Gemmatimonadota bacterium]
MGSRQPTPPRDIVRVFAALSDENRFRIVELLSNGRPAELSCGAIGAALGLSPSLISHHLAILEDARIIDRRKDGLWTLNRLRQEQLSRLLATLEGLVRVGSVAQPAD